MAYERILDSALWYTRVSNILYVACSYLTYVNVKMSGKTEMQLNDADFYWYQVLGTQCIRHDETVDLPVRHSMY